ncbi:hypothetical protein [Kribbella sp. NPDC051137]
MDDEVGDVERERFVGQLILPVDARTGLTAGHFAALKSFAGKGFRGHS